jgi:hypothetical protein
MADDEVEAEGVGDAAAGDALARLPVILAAHGPRARAAALRQLVLPAVRAQGTSRPPSPL